MMNGHLPSQCVTSNISSSASHSERVVTQMSIHSGLNSSPFVHPVHKLTNTHYSYQVTINPSWENIMQQSYHDKREMNQ